MVEIDELLTEYSESHQHPINKLIHWICVPLIVWSLLGMLWSLPAVLPVNWAVVLTALSMIYYLRVAPGLAVGILIVLTAMLLLLALMEQAELPLWKLALQVFALAWAGQFIGHTIEGKRPSFFKDVQFLLIGPLWLLSFVYKKLGIRF
jgi:uncharacterized membrane protein YGL010W